MVDFCPNCSNILRKQLMNKTYYLICKCGYKKQSEVIKNEDLQKIIQKKKEALEDTFIIRSNANKILIRPKIKSICPKCGFDEAVYWQEQLFSADEPMITFFRCLKCNRVWREY